MSPLRGGVTRGLLWSCRGNYEPSAALSSFFFVFNGCWNMSALHVDKLPRKVCELPICYLWLQAPKNRGQGQIPQHAGPGDRS